MSKITNKLSLPNAVVRAAENDSYSKDGADFTSTQLTNPPRAEALKIIYPNDLEIDASSRLASMLGQAIHNILERGARPEIDIVERRYFAKFQGYNLGGKIDLFESDSRTLFEYKTCLWKAFTKKNGSGKKPEWISQASINRYLMKLNGVAVDRVVIVGWLVDWRSWVTTDPAAPRAPVVQRDITEFLWDDQKTEVYINERIKLHAAAIKSLPECSSKETWGGTMCRSYCEAAPVCEQYQLSLKTGLLRKAGGE